MDEAQVSDTRLMEAIKEGNEAAFLSLYRRLQAPLFRFALHMSGSCSVAEDVTQEVFLTLIRRSSGFDARKGSIAVYLIGVARNCLRRRLRAERAFLPFAGTHAEDAEPVEGKAPEADPLSDLVRVETVRRVRAAVVSLPIHYREVLVLCDLEERSYQEASMALGCAEGTVRSRLHRARELLIRKLRPWESEAELEHAVSRRCPA